jgi:hypothetical protein
MRSVHDGHVGVLNPILVGGTVGKPGAAMASPGADLIVIDTRGKPHADSHGIGGYCRACRRYLRRAACRC